MEQTGSLLLRTDYRRPRTGPREHGRQAARSKRDGPAGTRAVYTQSAMCAPPEAAS
jgi:hypothetical protein